MAAEPWIRECVPETLHHRALELNTPVHSLRLIFAQTGSAPPCSGPFGTEARESAYYLAVGSSILRRQTPQLCPDLAFRSAGRGDVEGTISWYYRLAHHSAGLRMVGRAVPECWEFAVQKATSSPSRIGNRRGSWPERTID